MPGWLRQGLVFGLMVVGVVLALICVNAEAELQRRRQAACDASLSLPPSAYVLGAAGLLVGMLALLLLIRWFGRSRQVIAIVLYTTAVAGVVFEAFALITALQDPGACGRSAT
ncbi:hypothetical protein [Kribbella catacumbae]|uniref:hypothetical protein n=1 Tax=Kribbella catacumbae TaxID=460086 RepID=UPI00037E4FEE|nr:hypothetical protein [Kribbella catacumbae]